MKNASLWVQGLRPKTLPASIAPVLVGAASAWGMFTHVDGWGAHCIGDGTVDPIGGEQICDMRWYAMDGALPRFIGMLLLCLGVALFLQIAVNFANDYSDGIRGTDQGRGEQEDASGKPQRITASGLVAPKKVLLSAGVFAVLACLCGLAITVISQQYWFILVGVFCVLAGWFYTGGKHPYGYAGWGELFVFIFFGLVATLDTQYAISQSFDGSGVKGVRVFDFSTLGEHSVTSATWMRQGQFGIDETGVLAAICCGFYSVIVLMVNNLRDIDEDRLSGKRTLAVHLGHTGAKIALFACEAITLLISFPALVLAWMPWGVVPWLALIPIAVKQVRAISSGDFRRSLGLASKQLLAFTVIFVLSMVLSGTNM